VKRMPVNITKDATSNRPATTYFSFVSQVLFPMDMTFAMWCDVLVWLSLDFMALLSEQRELSREEQMSELDTSSDGRL